MSIFDEGLYSSAIIVEADFMHDPTPRGSIIAHQPNREADFMHDQIFAAVTAFTTRHRCRLLPPQRRQIRRFAIDVNAGPFMPGQETCVTSKCVTGSIEQCNTRSW
ncbi:hypothetical protein RND81_06G077400 [Saponaria officinalis]|uniref:Uncharacterized protein n=1 Tax=Saponaria officinalis TaxID=3572 RepID=A0AAW1K4D6_SAPOF